LLLVIDSRDPVDTFDELTWKFGVSPASMAWRLLNLHLIDESTRANLAIRTTADCAVALGKQEEHLAKNRQALEKRPPFRLAMAAVRAYLASETGIGPAAQLLGLEDEEARRLVTPDHSGESHLANPES
jgi:hypothetical protein